MFAQRQLRVKAVESLERLAKSFRTDEDLYPLRVPREPVPLADVIAAAGGGTSGSLQPLALRQRTLLHLAWEEGSSWEVWVIVLPSGLKLFCDAGAEGAHVLASGGRHASDETDRQFLQILCESAGERFGIEMAGGAPSRIRTSVQDRDFLAGIFVELFEITRAEDSVRRQIASLPRDAALNATGDDFRADVELWLARALA